MVLNKDVMFVIASKIDDLKTYNSFVRCNKMTGEIGRQLCQKKKDEFAQIKKVIYFYNEVCLESYPCQGHAILFMTKGGTLVAPSPQFSTVDMAKIFKTLKQNVPTHLKGYLHLKSFVTDWVSDSTKMMEFNTVTVNSTYHHIYDKFINHLAKHNITLEEAKQGYEWYGNDR